MILRPKATIANGAAFASAWDAVAATQKTLASRYQLVRQPDHARLAGRICERLAIAGAPTVDDDIARGISLHDEGWAGFDDGRKRLPATPASYSESNVALNAEGKPLSFLEIKAGDFLRAWLGSIEAAEATTPIAGLMVSGHFRRIGQFGMSTGTYSENDTQQLREFIAREEQRQRLLIRLQHRGEQEVEYWTDVLQFCDLLSLFLCCGSQASVEFPQRIGPKSQTIRLQVQNGVNVLSPTILAGQVEFQLDARAHPADARTPLTKLNWRLK